MSSVLGNALMTAVFLVVTFLGFTIVFEVTFSQEQAFAVARGQWQDRQATYITVSEVQADMANQWVTVTLENVGDTTLRLSEDTDVILYDLPELEAAYRATRLAYAANPIADQWTVTALTPDTTNPGLWDPGERVTLRLQPATWITSGSAIAVTVVVPNGATAATTVVAP